MDSTLVSGVSGKQTLEGVGSRNQESLELALLMVLLCLL